MGTEFDEFSKRAFVDYFKTENPEVHKNRMLLRDAMAKAGFIGYKEEWWHFSYGTKEWAIERNEPHAIYGSAEF